MVCIGCTSVVQCEQTVVLWSAEMRNFSAAECVKATRGNLRNFPHLIFRKLPLDNFLHFAIRIPQNTRARFLCLSSKMLSCLYTSRTCIIILSVIYGEYLANFHFGDIPHTCIPHFTLHSAEKNLLWIFRKLPLSAVRRPIHVCCGS